MIFQTNQPPSSPTVHTSEALPNWACEAERLTMQHLGLDHLPWNQSVQSLDLVKSEFNYDTRRICEDLVHMS